MHLLLGGLNWHKLRRSVTKVANQPEIALEHIRLSRRIGLIWDVNVSLQWRIWTYCLGRGQGAGTTTNGHRFLWTFWKWGATSRGCRGRWGNLYYIFLPGYICLENCKRSKVEFLRLTALNWEDNKQNLRACTITYILYYASVCALGVWIVTQRVPAMLNSSPTYKYKDCLKLSASCCLSGRNSSSLKLIQAINTEKHVKQKLETLVKIQLNAEWTAAVADLTVVPYIL